MNDPSMLWIVGLIAFIAIYAALSSWLDWRKQRGQKRPAARPSERQNPPLPPRGRRANTGGNNDLGGAGTDAASNNPGD